MKQEIIVPGGILMTHDSRIKLILRGRKVSKMIPKTQNQPKLKEVVEPK